MSADGSRESEPQPEPIPVDLSPRSKLGRGSAALGLGALAALGGSVLYFAVAAITGREFGLVAIVVGYMVGKAVQKGSRGRGGWAYQTLAVSLTYLAIVSTYVPIIAREFQSIQSRGAGSSATRPAIDTLPLAPNGLTARPASARLTASAQPDTGFPISQAGVPAGPALPTSTSRAHLSAGTVVLGIGELVLLAAKVPIAAGFSDIVGLLIIGIAVFEAWRLNRRGSLQIAAPYPSGSGADEGGTVG